jgi:gliding motility-associated-like protein
VLLLDGDPDLDIISELSGNFLQSNDACVVELDVFVATNQLAFEYVFGSDEYPEFVDNDFNDIFAFLISGPGIVGDPGLGTQKNIAVLPGVGAPVEINSVNQLLNWQFYRNNGLGQELEYDGLTSDYLGVKKSLTARSAVVPCNTYHLKLAIADRGDWSYDSGVFVSEIKAGAPDLKVQFAGGLDYFIEDCNAGLDKLVISLSEPATSLTTFTVTIGGSATQGVDYTLVIPSVITFQPGEQTLSFPISPLMDNLVEGTENIAIQLSNDFGCGAVVLKTLNVEIKDNVEVNVTGGDTLQVCAGTTLTLMAKGATTYFWAPPSAVSNPFIANPNITPTQDIWLEVTGTVLNCVDKDSVFIDIINVELDAIALANANICLGASVPLQAVNNVNGEGLSWLPIEGLNDPESSTPTATPTFTTTYVATLKAFGCTVVDSVTVKVDTLFAPNVIADTTVCQNYPVQLAEILNTTTEYQWSPSLGLSDANISGPIALPDQTTAYTLTATSANAYCSSTQNVTVSVVASDVDIAGGVYREICLGDTVQLSAQASPSGAAITWSPSFYVSNTSGAGVSAFPDESVTIFATYNINNCLVRDSVRLRVDSLPLLSIRREMDKSIYCPGDTIYLISKTYEPADFPDIQSEWLPFGTQLTPLDDWNMVIIATETHTFQRITVNNACSDTATVEVPVGIPPTFAATVEPPQICIGESAQINITVDPPGTKLMWDMATSSTLSCQDCPNPIATPLMTTTYTVSAPEADCPASTDVVVEVSAAPALGLADNPAICFGDSILLNSTNEPDVTYTWSPTTGLSSPNSGNPSAAPSQTTTYMLSAQLGNCTVERSVTVTVASATIDAGQDETICFGETTTLTATTTGTPGLVTWQPSNQTGNSISVSPSTSQVFAATLIYGPNCVATDEVQVSVPTRLELSDLNATPDPADSLCEGTPVLLKVRVISGQPTSIVWTLNGVAIPGQTLDSLQITPLGTPAVYAVVATDANGCTAATEPITYASKRCFAIPNAFTPGNGDDANDTFGPVVFGGQVTLTKFAVYNRWGQKVFEANAQQPRWDGRIGGTDAPVDVYVYHIRARFSNGQEEDFKGEITLLR